MLRCAGSNRIVTRTSGTSAPATPATSGCQAPTWQFTGIAFRRNTRNIRAVDPLSLPTFAR
ncbi:hypothetical protein [Sulfitobacter geojensis]|uniref:hypothetical protein n=1 Tax=Sulfitobacter geojensis TaxID=1342299 RepID=UPI000AF78BF7|nr:hypothetical protein [Sulfitobacter geojensis]KHA50998.1 hypothetical protein Z947_1280 [Sulfitobacter geojensis]NYI26635.1 hypothetical protein [Sulfitobacter geojensis]